MANPVAKTKSCETVACQGKTTVSRFPCGCVVVESAGHMQHPPCTTPAIQHASYTASCGKSGPPESHQDEMIVQCCVCSNVKNGDKWVIPLAEVKGEISHTYCPECAKEVRTTVRPGKRTALPA